MKSKFSPTAIGIFIAGAIVVIFASVILFGSGRFFRHTKTYLLTFREPVTGLEVGAPVKLLGVTIGTVKDIGIAVGEANRSVMINVLVEVDRKDLQDAVHGTVLDLDSRPRFEKMIKEQGLRGRLDILSLLSGQLYIALDFDPGQPGFELEQKDARGYWEIPTLPSTKRELLDSVVTSLNNLSQLDFKGLSTEMKGLLADLRKDLAELNFVKINTNLNQALTHLDGLVSDLDKNVNPLLANVDVDLKKAEAALDEATRALAGLKAQVAPGSDLTRELIDTLDRTSETMNSLRQLIDQLQRNPNSIITGKKESKESKP